MYTISGFADVIHVIEQERTRLFNGDKRFKWLVITDVKTLLFISKKASNIFWIMGMTNQHKCSNRIS